MKKPQLLYLASGLIILTGMLCAVSLVIGTAAFFFIVSAEPATATPSSVQISRLPPLNELDETQPPNPPSASQPLDPATEAVSQPQPSDPTIETAPDLEQPAPSIEPEVPPAEASDPSPSEEAADEEAAEGVAPAPVSEEARLVIANLDAQLEVVDLRNIGGSPQDITGWRLFSETGGEECLLTGIIEPGDTLQVWSQSAEGEEGGYSCGYPEGMWDDEAEDAAILYNSEGDIIYQRR